AIAEQRYRGNAANAQRSASEPLPFEEKHVADDSESESSQGKKVARQFKHRSAHCRRYAAADRHAGDHRHWRRPSERCGAISRAVGANSKEDVLSERDDAALAQQESHSQSSNRVERREDK